MERDIDNCLERHKGKYTRINEHYIVTPTKHGLMLVNAHALSIAQALLEQEAWAWEELIAMKPYVHGNVIDAGAFIGTHSLTFSETADRVFAFEPQPLCFDNLCANLLLNNNTKVTPIKTALGNYDGTTCMDIQSPLYLNAATGVSLDTGSEQVPVRKLDSLNMPFISFIKIDVEEYELEVLKGATELLKRDRPVIYIECHTQQLVHECSEFLAGLRYVGVPLIFTSVIFPKDYIPKETDKHKVYGYLFKQMIEPGDN
jgi:FkbM family methyltransferase